MVLIGDFISIRKPPNPLKNNKSVIKKFLMHTMYWFLYYDSKYPLYGKRVENYRGDKTTALLSLAVLQLLNWLTFLDIIQLYTHFNASDIFFSLLPEMPKKKNIEGYLWMFLVMCPFMVLSNFIIYRNTTQEEIDVYFSWLSEKQLLRSKIIFFTYVILTFGMMIYFGNLKLEQDEENKKAQYGTYK